jgi:hypothetical protein
VQAGGQYTADSVRFAASGPSGTIGRNVTLGGIHAGDQLLVEVHYVRSSDVMDFYAKDLTSGQFAFFHVNMGKLELYTAYINYANIGVTMDNSDIMPPAGSVSLAAFSQCQVDSNSHKGTGAASSSWSTREVFDSLDASSNTLTLAASLGSTGLTKRGQDFAVYLRPTS